MPTNLITAEGLSKLQDEFDYLWKIERPKVVQGVSDAAAEGDRSENAEYIYGKKRLREIDGKLKQIGGRLKVLKIAPLVRSTETVVFGCWVTYEDENGTVKCYRIVGPDETDVTIGKISVDSPVGKALMGKKVDDEISIRTPGGELTVCITAISASRN